MSGKNKTVAQSVKDHARDTAVATGIGAGIGARMGARAGGAGVVAGAIAGAATSFAGAQVQKTGEAIKEAWGLHKDEQAAAKAEREAKAMEARVAEARRKHGTTKPAPKPAPKSGAKPKRKK